MTADQLKPAVGHTRRRSVVPRQTPLALVPAHLSPAIIRVPTPPTAPQRPIAIFGNLCGTPETDIAVCSTAKDEGSTFFGVLMIYTGAPVKGKEVGWPKQTKLELWQSKRKCTVPPPLSPIFLYPTRSLSSKQVSLHEQL